LGTVRIVDGPLIDRAAEDYGQTQGSCPSQNAHRTGWAVGLLVGVAMCAWYVVQAATRNLLDLSVFRDAGYAVIHNMPLYSQYFPSTSGFRFIYPPFAAMLFAPMAVVPQCALQLGWSVFNLLLVWWILRMILARLCVRSPNWAAMALLGPVLVFEPIRSNFAFGQVNIALMALVIADCLGVLPRRLRGIGIGIAAGIKITPAAFGLVLLFRRDGVGMARALAAFTATVVIGFLGRPQESLYFWGIEFFRTDRAGRHEYASNQALTGLIARLGAAGVLEDVLWLLGVAAIVAAAVFAGRRFTQSGMHIAATAVVALAALLAAPLAVTHHWTYVVFLIPLLVAQQHRRWRPLLMAAGIVFVAGPHFALPGGDIAGAGPVIRQVVGNAQLITGVALLIGAVCAARSLTPVEAPSLHERPIRHTGDPPTASRDSLCPSCARASSTATCRRSNRPAEVPPLTRRARAAPPDQGVRDLADRFPNGAGTVQPTRSRRHGPWRHRRRLRARPRRDIEKG
jgi:alpha-1,2-mannosyltransferase